MHRQVFQVLAEERLFQMAELEGGRLFSLAARSMGERTQQSTGAGSKEPRETYYS